MTTHFDRLARRRGFDPERLTFTIRTAVGAFLALLIASALGLEHPQWAAMTVWIATQSVRGHLLEKSLFRLLGTTLGVSYGVALVAVSGGTPRWLVIGLALWVGLCAGAGQLIRGFASYGTLLAGYSAAMVTLLDTARPDHVAALAADRVLTIGVGAAVAIMVSVRAARPSEPEAAEAVIRELMVQRLRELAIWARGGAAPSATARHTHLADLAVLEGSLELQAAGSLRARRQVPALRQALTTQVGLLLWWPQAVASAGDRGPRLAKALDRAATAIDSGEGAGIALERAATIADHDAALADALIGLAHAVELHSTRSRPFRVRPAAPCPVAFHRNWVDACEAALRAMSVLLVVGWLWLASDEPTLSSLMMGVAIMTSVFSTADDPARLMRSVLAGQALGATAAITVQGLLFPFAHGMAGRLLICLPVVLLGAFVLAHPRTARAGLDFNLVALMLLQPLRPPAVAWEPRLISAVAVVAAPLLGLLVYRWIFPRTSGRQFAMLSRQMHDEVAAMATRPGILQGDGAWIARLHHRQLRLTRAAGLAATGASGRAINEGLAALNTGRAVLALQHALVNDDLPPATRRRAKTLLQRLGQTARTPTSRGRVARSLERAAHSSLALTVDPATLQRAADAMLRPQHA